MTYASTSDHGNRLATARPIVTAGLKCPPETAPTAYAMTSTATPNATATPSRSTPSLPASSTAVPHPANTSTNVPRNSAPRRCRVAAVIGDLQSWTTGAIDPQFRFGAIPARRALILGRKLPILYSNLMGRLSLAKVIGHRARDRRMRGTCRGLLFDRGQGRRAVQAPVAVCLARARQRSDRPARPRPQGRGGHEVGDEISSCGQRDRRRQAAVAGHPFRAPQGGRMDQGERRKDRADPSRRRVAVLPAAQDDVETAR